jgi:muconolactone delta-isomerase
VPLEATREGILVTARSGHGKTRLIYSVVGSLINLGLNFVIWDIKDDHMELARIYSCVFVVNWNDLKFNPLTNAPKGMKIEMWWRKVWEIFCHSFGILIASSSYILEKLEELYEDRKGTVMFNDLYQFLKSASEQSKRRDEYLSVAENRIYTVNQALGDVLNCKYGFEVSEIFSQKIVIRLRGLDNSMQGFLVQILLMHEFYSRMYGRVRL